MFLNGIVPALACESCYTSPFHDGDIHKKCAPFWFSAVVDTSSIYLSRPTVVKYCMFFEYRLLNVVNIVPMYHDVF